MLTDDDKDKPAGFGSLRFLQDVNHAEDQEAAMLADADKAVDHRWRFVTGKSNWSNSC